MIMFLFGHDDVIFMQVFDNYRMIIFYNNVTQEKNFFEIPGSTIFKLKDISYDHLTAEGWR